VPSRPPPPLADETSVPAFAAVGAEVRALGWHGGTHRWFRARVVKLRPRFPKIHVKFLADAETGAAHPLALPLVDAYLHAGQLAPWP